MGFFKDIYNTIIFDIPHYTFSIILFNCIYNFIFNFIYNFQIPTCKTQVLYMSIMLFSDYIRNSVLRINKQVVYLSKH